MQWRSRVLWAVCSQPCSNFPPTTSGRPCVTLSLARLPSRFAGAGARTQIRRGCRGNVLHETNAPFTHAVVCMCVRFYCIVHCDVGSMHKNETDSASHSAREDSPFSLSRLRTDGRCLSVCVCVCAYALTQKGKTNNCHVAMDDV